MTRRGLVPVLPMALTLGNLACGFVAMAKTVDALNHSTGGGPFDHRFVDMILDACWLIGLAMVFDALDGWVARLTSQTSRFGAQLDSLSDIVTFGAAPALIAKVVYEHTVLAIDGTALDTPFRPRIVTLLCTLYLMGAAMRLARYTISAAEEEGGESAPAHTFLGLPSPAAAGLVVSTCLFAYGGREDIPFVPTGIADAVAIALVRGLPLIACGLGLLMVSRVHYVHVAKRYFARRMSVETFALLVLLVWAVFLFHSWLLFAIALVYTVGGLALAVRARLLGGSPVDLFPRPPDEHDEEARSEASR